MRTTTAVVSGVGPGFTARTLRRLLRLYQGWSATRMPRCRYEPSCSAYAYTAIGEYGAVRGAWFAARRIARCRPGSGFGFDPVPVREVSRVQ